MDLYPHQEDAVRKLRNGSILWGGVGSGKSRTAVAYYMKQEAPRDVYVITTAKKRDSLDWNGEFAAVGVGTSKDATVAGVLCIDSWNNLSRYSEVRGAFFIFDEQRLVGSGEWVKSFLRIARANRWILLSATPGDNWLDYIPVFVANGFYKNRTEFKREHVVYNTFSKFPKVDRYIGVGRLVRLRNSILVEMPYTKHTIRNTRVIDVDYDKSKYEEVLKKRWNPFENRPLRDVAEMFLVARKVVNSDTSRIEAVRQLLRVHPRLVVFYNFDYELEILRGLDKLPSTWDSRQEMSTDGSRSTSTNTTDSLTNTSPDPGKNDIVPAEWNGTPTNWNGETTESNNSSRKISWIPNQSTAVLPEISANGTTESFAISEWNGHKHQPIPDTDRWVYLVQYVAGSEGWNCTETNAVCFYSLTYSYKNWHQAYGRIDRLNTPYTELFYYVLKSKASIDSAVMKSLRDKKSFNESHFVNSKTWSNGGNPGL